MKKLSHPFISELKRCVANQNRTLGPIVMALSELIGLKGPSSTDSNQIRRKQKKLSEVTDMIHAAHVFHRCVRDNGCDNASVSAKRLHQDNIMSLLIGDYLLAQSSVDMADLKYPKTVGLIARGLEDYTRGEFLKLQLLENLRNEPLELKHQIERYAELTCGSLLSNACLSAALLAGHPDRTATSTTTTTVVGTQKQNIARHQSNDLTNLIYAFGFHTGSAHRLIEILYCPDTNSEADRVFIETLDVCQFEGSIKAHVDKSIELLLRLPIPNSENTISSGGGSDLSKERLLTMLNDMKSCHRSG